MIYRTTRERMDSKICENGRIFVLVEREGPTIAPITFELLGMGKRIATQLKEALCAVTIGHEVADVSNKITHFVDEV